MNQTEITIEELRTKSEGEVINICKCYPYHSQWINKDAYGHCKYVIARMQGRQYTKTGNINSFRTVLNNN